MTGRQIPSPESVIGYKMGTARKLPTWQEIVEYFQQLASASDRVKLETIGETTLGRPYIAVTVSSPENLSRRDELRQILGKLWDPRGRDDAEIADLVERGRTTNVLLCTQHSSEIGACLMTLELAYQLASSDGPETLEILENTVTVMVPCHNPDGHDMEVEWYQRWLDTEYEGQPMPWLYHHYVGHDNNRDWYMLTQLETRHFVSLHNREHPQMVFDMHQMHRDGARFMVPPFIDPLDPNQDPIIQQGFADLGTYIASRMTAEGLAGVATNIIFDNYSPSLAYGNYHGSTDLLSEAASVRLATPVEVKEKDLEKGRGFDPTQRTWNHPLPWKGGEWTLEQIVNYDRVAALAFIEHAARNRRQWLRNYAAINQRTIARDEPPFAYLVPAEQRDPVTTYELLEILQAGIVEIELATKPFTADGVEYPSGTVIIPLRQPAGNYAKTLLEVQKYPDLRLYPGGPPKPPYDITGHTLGIQMGVQVIEVKNEFEYASTSLDLSQPVGEISGAGTAGYLISPSTNASVLAVNKLLGAGHTVERITDGDRTGAFFVAANNDLAAIARDTGVSIEAVESVPDGERLKVRQPRIGIYQPWKATIDEGWTRWILERYGFGFTSLHNNDIRQGGLAGMLDVIILAQQPAKDIVEGVSEKNKWEEPYPPEYVGGLGTLGMGALHQFVRDGGTLVAIDSAGDAVIQHLYLPVRNVVADLKRDEFFCPGSLLRIILDTEHPLAYGLERESVAVFSNSPVYDLKDRSAGKVVARYAQNSPSLSGWILGDKKLAGMPAVLELPLGSGRVILLPFRVQHRAQARASYKLLFNALWRSKPA